MTIISEVQLSFPNTGDWKFKARALWDTGATHSCITKSKAAEMGLAATSKAQVFHAGGQSVANVYHIGILLPNDLPADFIKVTECDTTQGNFDIIIGMDIISQGDFAFTNHEGKSTFSFRYPSTHCIDFVEEFNKDNIKNLRFKKQPRRR